MEPDRPTSPAWSERERAWRRKLGRLRLGAEPLDEQLTRHRHVAWGLTAVAGLIAALFLAIFTAFQAPLLGLAVAGILFGPIVLTVWLEYGWMRRRARAYEQERRACLGDTRPMDARA
jgi:hypothetical protein